MYGQHLLDPASAYHEEACPGLLGVGGGSESGELDYSSKGLHTEAYGEPVGVWGKHHQSGVQCVPGSGLVGIWLPAEGDTVFGSYILAGGRDPQRLTVPRSPSFF